MHIAVHRVSKEQQSLSSIRVLQALLSCVQAEWITMFNASGLNPLHLAVKLSCLSATKLILNSSPHSVLCCTQGSGDNIIHLAAQHEQLSFMEFLLCCVKDAGLSASDCSMIQNKVGRTARFHAANVHENGGRGKQLALHRVDIHSPRASCSEQGGSSSLAETASQYRTPTQGSYSAFLLRCRGLFLSSTQVT